MAEFHRPQIKVDAVQLTQDLSVGEHDPGRASSKSVLANKGDWLVTYPDGKQVFMSNVAFKAEFKGGSGIVASTTWRS